MHGAQIGRPEHFYPRSPCGERPQHPRHLRRPNRISIHALLAESDSQCRTLASGIYDFYPRSPCGERRRGASRASQEVYFYPRSPCGERLVHALKLADAMLFLSTLSLRRATYVTLYPKAAPYISIHALLAESDGLMGGLSCDKRNFYPRSPCGERQRL